MTLSKCCGGISAHSSVLCPFFGDFAGAFLIIVMLHNLTGHELLVGHSPSAFPGREQNSWLDELSRSSHSKTAPDNHTTTRTIDCWFDVLDGWIDKKNRIFMCVLSRTSWMFPITAHFVNHTHERNLGLVMLLSNSVYHCPTSHSASATVLMHTHAHTHWHGVV